MPVRAGILVLAALAVGGCFAEVVDVDVDDGPDTSGGTGSIPVTTDGATTDDPGATTGVDPSESTTGGPDDTTGGPAESSTSGGEESSSSGPGCEPGTLGCECDADACDEGVCRDDLCVMPVCGDGLLEGDELCDDGNDAAQDGCEADCTMSTGVAKIASGDQHSCALFHDGRLRCWGSNNYGELGYGNIENVGDDETPASVGDVPIGAPVVDVALGREHTCVILEGGAVRCWGLNNRFQLGIPSYEINQQIGDEPDELPSMLPDVNLGGPVVGITASTWTTFVLYEDGSVRCFGQNSSRGTCGYGNGDFMVGDDEHPVLAGPVELGAPAVAIDGHGDHVCAILDDGTMRCWGMNESGALGIGNTEDIGNDELPTSVPAIAFDEPIVEVQTGLRHTCVRLESGTVKCWGLNSRAELGLGNTDDVLDAYAMTTVAVGGEAVDLAVGGGHGCVLLADGNVRCWGDANFGRLGYGDATNDVGDDELPESMDPLPLAIDVVHDLDVGNSFSCARVDDGEVMCWGANNVGQIGQPGLDYFGDNETLGALSPIVLDD